jgi:type 1 fimbriae regulatory protein FimE
MSYWTPQELLTVLTAAKRKSVRNHCIILLAYRHGLRRAEIQNLTLDDVRDGQIDVRRLKGSLHTVQPLYADSNPLLDEKRALAAWLRERGDADGSVFLFTSRNGGGIKARAIFDIFEDAAFAAKLPAGRRGAHQAKHALASHLIRNGASVAYVQQALGHRDPKSTLSYTHITQTEAAEVVTSTLGRVFASV